ncbi:hypothetical protein FC961_16870 [Clostridium botulinum]|nr:hypothetical protein [Clostridium botulinum]NFO92658.1 hypothetical protein [Clostridium botulinum]
MDYILVKEDKNLKYSSIIIQTACEAPTLLLKDICKELDKNDIHGEILIDSLLYSGNCKERFITATFENGDFNKDSFSFVHVDRGSFERKITSDYLREYEEILKSSCLTETQKKLIKKGLNL